MLLIYRLLGMLHCCISCYLTGGHLTMCIHICTSVLPLVAHSIQTTENRRPLTFDDNCEKNVKPDNTDKKCHETVDV